MTPPPDGTPGWMWLAAVVLLGAMTMLGTYVSTRGMRKDIRVTRAQTENEHSDAEFPNLRDEITAMHADVRQTQGLVHGLEKRVGGIEKHLADIGEESERIEDTMERRKMLATRNLESTAEVLREEISAVRDGIPGIIRAELGAHVGACPLRHPGDDIPTA